MPIKADTIMGFRARIKVIVMEILDELGLIKPAKKSTPKPPPDPKKIMNPKVKGKAKKVASILLVFGLASFMLCGNSFALLRPRNMDQVTTSTWTFQNVNIATGLTVAAVTISGGTVNDSVIGGSTPAAITGTTITGSTFTDQSMSVTAGVFSGIADLGAVTTADINAGTFDGVVGGTAPAAGDFTVIDIDQTPTANAYTDAILSTWEAGADMAAGGSNGIYAISKPIEDVQNAYSIRGRTDLREATADVSVNQTHTIDGLINLNETYYYFVDDNMSIFGGAVHGNAAGGIGGTGTGALGGATLNVMFGMWGPTATADVDVETNFIKMISHAATTVDYGLNIESSSDMEAGILLNSHSSNSPATMDVGLEMISAANKMVYGIDMSEASFTTGDIRVDGAQVITSGAWSLNSEVYAGVPGTLPVGSMAIGTGKVYIKLTNNGNEGDWQYIDTTDD